MLLTTNMNDKYNNSFATLEFVRMLQSMAKVEESPHFKSKKYVIVDRKDRAVNPGEVPVVLKHPESVIVVASPTGKAPPPAFDEMRVDKLFIAIIVQGKLKSFICKILIEFYCM